MSFKKLSKKFSLEEFADKEIKMEFPEGMRKGTIQETKEPSYPFSFNFTQMNINKTLYLRETDIKISKKEIRYASNYYALENHF